jgi:ABC-2 type transport system permease protein
VSDVLRHLRRSLTLWAIAVAAVAAMYISFYPSIGGTDVEELIENLPEALVTALRYDAIATAAGYLTSTVYGLLGPILLHFGWYLESDPLVEGFDLRRLALLAVPPVAAAGIALTVFDRPDLAV